MGRGSGVGDAVRAWTLVFVLWSLIADLLTIRVSIAHRFPRTDASVHHWSSSALRHGETSSDCVLKVNKFSFFLFFFYYFFSALLTAASDEWLRPHESPDNLSPSWSITDSHGASFISFFTALIAALKHVSRHYQLIHFTFSTNVSSSDSVIKILTTCYSDFSADAFSLLSCVCHSLIYPRSLVSLTD